MQEQLPVDEATTWWRLTAGRGGVLEDDWLDGRYVSVGWGEAGPDLDDPDVDAATVIERDPSPDGQLSAFLGYDEGIEAGDVVVAYAPEKGHVTGVGRVGEVKYDPDRTYRYLTAEEAATAGVDDHDYWRPVSWFDWGTPVAVSELPARYHATGADRLATEATLARYGSLAADRDRLETLAEAVRTAETAAGTDGAGAGAARESELADWVVANAADLGVSAPRREVATDVGRIDVLATDDQSEVVIEVRRGRAGDRAIGQLLGYMGARRNDSSTPVRGLLIAESFTPRAREAASIIETISLFEFDVTTSVTPI